MIQQLTKQELNDIADVMIKTRVASKSKLLNQKQTIIYCLLLAVILYVASFSLVQFNVQLGQFCMLMFFAMIALAAYIYFYQRGLKKNIQKMVSSKLQDPIEVNIMAEHIRYNGKNYAYKSIDRMVEYKSLFYLTMGTDFMVVKDDGTLMKLIDKNPSFKYVRYKKPFNLFEKD